MNGDLKMMRENQTVRSPGELRILHLKWTRTEILQRELTVTITTANYHEKQYSTVTLTGIAQEKRGEWGIYCTCGGNLFRCGK